MPKWAAKQIRRAILDARKQGWANPPRMTYRQAGMEYENHLYGKAWERTMKAVGNYPPRSPRA